MKSLSRLVAALAFLLATTALMAQNNGPAANGDFDFNAGGNGKNLKFDARIKNNGQTRGVIVLSGLHDLGDQDVDGGGDANPGGLQAGFTFTAEVDCLSIDANTNRAVMAGVVTSSSVPGYIGVRTLLVVQDGGEGKGAVDKFTWGVYRGVNVTWIASDAELVSDPGVGLTWWATDAEDPFDTGRPSHPPNTGVNCQTFGAHLYDLVELPKGAGNIQVKP